MSSRWLTRPMRPRQRVLAALAGRPIDRPAAVCPTSIATEALMDQVGAPFPQAHRDAETMSSLAETAYTDAGFDTTLVARHDAQIEAGARLGARNGTDGTYDLVVDAAGTRAALEAAVALCRPGGTLLLVASYWDGLIELPRSDPAPC